MKLYFDLAWILIKTLSFGGLAVALVGVAIFGWNFVRINARAGRGDSGEIPRESWRGKGATLGLQLLALGVVMQIASFILSASLPHRF
jgi:hypothetical protein